MNENKKAWVKKLFDEASRDNIKIIEFNGKRVGTVAVDNNTGETAISYCSPKDKMNYDLRVGIAISYARLRGIKIPDFMLKPTFEDIAGSIIKLNGQFYYISPVPTIQYYKAGYNEKCYALIPLHKCSGSFLKTIRADETIWDDIEIYQTKEEVKKNY